MDIPKIDKRSRQDIEDKEKSLSKNFVKQWNFDTQNPDMAAAVAIIYSELTAKTIEKYNLTLEKNMMEFFSLLGVQPLCCEPAKGYASFFVLGKEESVKGEFIDKGSEIFAVNDQGEKIVFSVLDDLYAVNAAIADVVCTDGFGDKIYRLYEGENQEEICKFSSNCANTPNEQKHILYFSCEIFDNMDNSARGCIFFNFDLADDVQRAAFLNQAADEGVYYSTENGFFKCENICIKGESIEFSFNCENPPAITELMGIKKYWFKIEFKEVKEIQRIYINEIAAASYCEQVKPQGIFNDDGQISSARFYPFGENLNLYSSVYFVCSNVLSKTCANITLEFKVEYLKRLIMDNAVQSEINWKHIMKKTQFKKPQQKDVTVKSVVWEYFNGSGWVKLFEDDEYSDVFNGENGHHTVKIKFKCPKDISKVSLAVGETYGIRARISVIENYMNLNGFYIIPQVSSPVFKYDYETFIKCDYLIRDNCMEKVLSKLGEESLKAAYAQDNSTKSLNFGFTAPLDKAGIKILFVLDKSDYSKNKNFRWEYFSQTGWKELDCSDETHGISKTGIVMINRDIKFSKAVFWGKRLYWIRIRFFNECDYPTNKGISVYLNSAEVSNTQAHEDEYFYISPDDHKKECRLSCSDVYKAKVMVNEISEFSQAYAAELVKRGKASANYNQDGEMYQLWVEWDEAEDAHIEKNKRQYILNRESSKVIFGVSGGKIPPKSPSENVKISYVTCDGQKGELEKATEFFPVNGGGLISKIISPLKMTGGEGRESVSKTVRRSAQNLRMHSRCRTNEDYENIVWLTQRNVLRVKALSGINGKGEKEYGAVTIVVLLKDEEYFEQMRENIQNAIEEKRCANISINKLKIVKPVYVIFNVKADITVKNYDLISGVRKNISLLLENFFDVLKGNTDSKGWDIGQLPTRIMISGLLTMADGVEWVNELYISLYNEQGNEITDSELQNILRCKMAMPKLGEVSLTLK